MRVQTIGDASQVDGKSSPDQTHFCRAQLTQYGMSVTNFTTAWTDGRALTCLVDSLSPTPNLSLLQETDFSDPIAVVEAAMARAFTQLGVPRLIDAIDWVQCPDNHSIMTYISYFQKAQASNPDANAVIMLPLEHAIDVAAADSVASFLECRVSCRHLIQAIEFSKSDPIVGLYSLHPERFECKTESVPPDNRAEFHDDDDDDDDDDG